MHLFVLLRLPISILLLLGFAVSNLWQEPGMRFFGVVFVVGLLVYLGVVMVKLARFRTGALQLAVCLLALEVAGAVLFVSGADLARGRSLGKVAFWACVVVLLWTLPNAAILYSQRAKFTETKNPGV
jgi:hypothetical protein